MGNEYLIGKDILNIQMRLQRVENDLEAIHAMIEEAQKEPEKDAKRT